ncbi:hypothetical protein ABI_16300 [Asticcacaulis biprosthecium C19]|uniref:Uncharacterized protein n=1 Tax=Asticcacaulis biprosthecium C19 TaxID=715226 RepID=F4QJT3_9CAUL|nr:hypothetical protein [Asticcacaulis biprosthecium]EGF93190.1 hypothetical protein ABI_16300 [Asticcacaulis biprosthecium C19]
MIEVNSVEDFVSAIKQCDASIRHILRRTKAVHNDTVGSDYNAIVGDLLNHAETTRGVLTNIRQNVRLMPHRADALIGKLDNAVYMYKGLRELSAFRSHVELYEVNVPADISEHIDKIGVSMGRVSMGQLLNLSDLLIAGMKDYVLKLIKPPEVDGMFAEGQDELGRPAITFTPSQILSPVRFVFIDGKIEVIPPNNKDPKITEEVEGIRNYILSESNMVLKAMAGGNLDPRYIDFVKNIRDQVSRENIDVFFLGTQLCQAQSYIDTVEDNKPYSSFVFYVSFVSNAMRYCTTFNDWKSFIASEYTEIDFGDVLKIKNILIDFLRQASGTGFPTSMKVLEEVGQVCAWDVYPDTSIKYSKSVRAIWYVYITTCYNLIAAAYGEIFKGTFGRQDLIEANINKKGLSAIAARAVSDAESSQEVFAKVKSAAWISGATPVIAKLL